MVTKAAVADVFVFDGANGILLEVAPNAGSWPRIHEAWDKFAEFIASKTAPPLSKGDVRERSDAVWNAAATQYLETRVSAEQAQKALTEAKDRLVALASHTSESGGGVTVTRYWKQGAIQYGKIAELKAMADVRPSSNKASLGVTPGLRPAGNADRNGASLCDPIGTLRHHADLHKRAQAILRRLVISILS